MDNQQAGQKSPILKAAWDRYHTSLARTMHEGTDFHGHARNFGDVGA